MTQLNSFASSGLNSLIDSKLNSFADDAEVHIDTVQLESFLNVHEVTSLFLPPAGPNTFVQDLGPTRTIHTKFAYEWLADVAFRGVDRGSGRDTGGFITNFTEARFDDTLASHPGWSVFPASFLFNPGIGPFPDIDSVFQGHGNFEEPVGILGDPFQDPERLLCGEWIGSDFAFRFFGTSFPPPIEGFFSTAGGPGNSELAYITVFDTPLVFNIPSFGVLSHSKDMFPQRLQLPKPISSPPIPPGPFSLLPGLSPDIYLLEPEA